MYQGEKVQPSNRNLIKIINAIRDGESWTNIFPGVASMKLTAKGYGSSLDLQFTKNKGIPIHMVPEGTPGATVVGIKKVDMLSFYNLSTNDLVKKFGFTEPKLRAIILLHSIRDDVECYKEINIGKTTYKRYSQKAIDRIKKIMALKGFSISKTWKEAKYKKLV